jgi:uncharacterized caspase-like protein
VKRAVLIGVDEYRDERIQDLEGSRNDAFELANLLAKSGDFEVEDPLLGSKATGEAIRTAVSDLLWRTDEADLALLYFSGHAYDDTYGNGFLAPHNMDYERPWVHGVRMQELNDLMLKAINKDVVLLVLDACKSGIAASGQKGAEPARPFKDAFVQIEETVPEGRGRIVLASSGADEKSHELRGEHQYLGGESHAHGAFTFHMLEALSGRAASDGENVSLDDLTEFVDHELKGQTFTFFGSGLQHSKQIALVRATEFASISTKLNEASELLKTGAGEDLFRAISALKTVRSQTGKNQQVVELRNAIDQRLDGERETVVFYLVLKKMELIDKCPRTCERIERVLDGISFDSLVLDDEPYLLPLTLGLWQASQCRDDDVPYRAWLSQMRSVEKRLTEPPPVAKSAKGVRSRK